MLDSSWQKLFERGDRVDEDARGIRYRARSLQTGRAVLLEILHAGAASSFPEERRASRLVSNSGLVRCLDSSLAHTGKRRLQDDHGGAAPWVATEWLDGATLAAQQGAAPLSVARVVSLFYALRRTIQALHDADIVHGGLTPECVFIETAAAGEPDFRVFDFAVVPRADRLVGVHGRRGAQHAAAWAYRAPELREPGRDVDRRTDIFALGAILCFCIAPNRLAQAADGNPELALEDVAKSSDVRVRALAAVAQRCMSPHPEQRPRSAQLVALFDANQAAVGRAVSAPPSSLCGGLWSLLLPAALVLFLALKTRHRAAGHSGRSSEPPDQVDEAAGVPRRASLPGRVSLYGAADVSNRGSSTAIDTRVQRLLRELEPEFVDCTHDGDGTRDYRFVLNVAVQTKGTHRVSLTGDPLPKTMQNCVRRVAARLDLPKQWGDQILRAPMSITAPEVSRGP